MSRSYPQQGVEGTDGRYIRRDGSVALTAFWNANQAVLVTSVRANAGGNVVLGDYPNFLRTRRSNAEILELIGESNNQASLYLKNLRIADLAGVGNRNVIADVNGDLSAP